jgi:hypothetical protein
MGGMHFLGIQDGLGNPSFVRHGDSVLPEFPKQSRQQDTADIRRQISLITRSNVEHVGIGSHYVPWLQVLAKPRRPPPPEVRNPRRGGSWTEQETEILTRMIGMFASGDKQFAARHDDIYGPSH